MKKISKFSIALASALTLLLPSCALLNRDEFAQRKYYNFPRSRHTITAQQPEPRTSTSTIANAVNAQNEHPATSAAHPAAQPDRTAAPVSGLSRSSSEDQTPALTEAAAPVVDYSAPDTILPVSAPAEVFDAPGTSGGMFIIMIIAAILLPFIGVYLKDNGRTNKWFWITLILCLAGAITGGIGIVYAFGGLWFIAAIIALLVVFDVL